MTVVLGKFTNTCGQIVEIVQTHEGYFISHDGVMNPDFKIEDPIIFLCSVCDGYAKFASQLMDSRV